MYTGCDGGYDFERGYNEKRNAGDGVWCSEMKQDFLAESRVGIRVY